MLTIDLSHTIAPDMPVYPGTEPPHFETPVSIEKDGYTETKISLFSHTGTHVDAPAHMLTNGSTLDNMAIETFVGPGFVIDLSKSRHSLIDLEILMPFKQQIEGNDFVLIHSGWSDLWGSSAYFGNYPVLSREAAEWIGEFNLKGIGIDMISVDTIGSKTMPVHNIIFEHNMIIIENLTNLDALLNKKFTLLLFTLLIILLKLSLSELSLLSGIKYV